MPAQSVFAETLPVTYDAGTIKTDKVARLTVDTTVQHHSANATLMLKAIEQIYVLAQHRGVALRQPCARVSKRAALMAGP